MENLEGKDLPTVHETSDQGKTIVSLECESACTDIVASGESHHGAVVPADNSTTGNDPMTLGTGNMNVTAHILRQLAVTMAGGKVDAGAALEKSFELMVGLASQDQIESMLAAQMIASHNLAMDLMSKASITDNSLSAKHYTTLANRTMAVFVTQVEALNRYRSKGQQKIIVQHVTVNDGGQATVKAIVSEGGKN